MKTNTTEDWYELEAKNKRRFITLAVLVGGLLGIGGSEGCRSTVDHYREEQPEFYRRTEERQEVFKDHMLIYKHEEHKIPMLQIEVTHTSYDRLARND